MAEVLDFFYFFLSTSEAIITFCAKYLGWLYIEFRLEVDAGLGM